jgi:hypothetical protein
MQAITTIGLDIAKSVFQVHGVDAQGTIAIRRPLKRLKVERPWQWVRRSKLTGSKPQSAAYRICQMCHRCRQSGAMDHRNDIAGWIHAEPVTRLTPDPSKRQDKPRVDTPAARALRGW